LGLIQFFLEKGFAKFKSSAIIFLVGKSMSFYSLKKHVYPENLKKR